MGKECGQIDCCNKATLLPGLITLLYLGCKVLACLCFLLSYGYSRSYDASIPLWHLEESSLVEEDELPIM